MFKALIDLFTSVFVSIFYLGIRYVFSVIDNVEIWFKIKLLYGMVHKALHWQTLSKLL